MAVRTICLPISSPCPELAAKNRDMYYKAIRGDYPDKAWRFLTGDKHEIMQLTSAAGYRFRKMHDGQFLHQVVACHRDALAHQDFISRAAHPCEVDAFCTFLLSQFEQFRVLRGNNNHFREHRIVAVQDNVDMVFFEHS